MPIRFTNKHNLHRAVYRAIVSDPYDNGGADYSPTSLSIPARAKAIVDTYDGWIDVDIINSVPSLIGQGAHTVAERAIRSGLDIGEKRFFADFIVNGVTYKVSAQIDLYELDSCELSDWKTTKCYAVSKKAGAKKEWEAQLNIGAELLRRQGLNPKKLTIIALLKDWSERSKDPELECVSVNIPVWESSKVSDYISERITAHTKAKLELPRCTPEETWGGRRCARWCDAASVCEQYQSSLKTGII